MVILRVYYNVVFGEPRDWFPWQGGGGGDAISRSKVIKLFSEISLI